jgi:uncharacterized protein with HEPN domain
LSSRDSRVFLRDIAEAVDMIQDFTFGIQFEGFRGDNKTIAAVERKLLVISEAAIRLGEQAPLLCPDIPLHKVRGTGNWIRHAYERIDLESLWHTVTDDLPQLKMSVVKALARTAE